MDLTAALAARRTVREFAPDAITDVDLRAVVWAGQGITGPDGARTAPSAGALRPLSLLVLAGAVAGRSAGGYDYEPDGDRLVARFGGDVRDALAEAAIDEQPWVADCAAVIVVTADMERPRREFAGQQPDGRRGERYVHLEAGAALQNMHLAATQRGLGAVLVGGFDDATVGAVLRLSAGAVPVAMLCVGAPA